MFKLSLANIEAIAIKKLEKQQIKSNHEAATDDNDNENESVISNTSPTQRIIKMSMASVNSTNIGLCYMYMYMSIILLMSCHVNMRILLSTIKTIIAFQILIIYLIVLY